MALRNLKHNVNRASEGGNLYHKFHTKDRTSILQKKLSYEALNCHFCKPDVAVGFLQSNWNKFLNDGLFYRNK